VVFLSAAAAAAAAAMTIMHNRTIFSLIIVIKIELINPNVANGGNTPRSLFAV